MQLDVTVAPPAAKPANEGVLVTGSTMKLEVAGATGRACADTQTAECRIACDCLESTTQLRNEVLEPLVLFLLTRPRRTPVHAAAFVAEGLGVVLAGPSGSGKSCLARAADAAGLQVLSEDTVYIQQEPRWRLWGHPRVVHLLPGDAAATAGPRRLRNGRLKHVLGLRSATSAPLNCDCATLCILERGAAKASLSRLSPPEAIARLWPLDPGFDLLERAIADALAVLTARGAWRLSLSADPAEAIHLLCANLPLLRETALG